MNTPIQFMIYPERTWLETIYFLASPNCSPNVKVPSIGYNQGTVIIGATNLIEAGGAISPGNDVEFICGGEVNLTFNPAKATGFRIRTGSELKITTGTNICP